MPTIVVKIGNKLRELREEKFLSHRELARLAAISPTTVFKAESNEGDTQRRTVRKLADALGVEPGDLLDD